MKFRGRITEQICIKKFYSILVSMGKISKDCVMRLTSEKVYFILSDQAASGGPAVWCEIEQECYFNEYNIEGVSPDQNEIFLEFVPDKMAKTLTTLKTSNPRSVKMKLIKRSDVPCLTFELEMGQPLRDRNCVHDFPVVVLPRRMWGDYKEPTMPQFDLSICLPELKKLRHLMERYRSLGQAVTITANKEGRLTLKVESDDGVFSTHYPNLKVPVYRDETLPWQMTDSQLMPDSASVRVDLKRFNIFLVGEQLQPRRVIANIVEREMLHMFFLHDDLIVQYFLPATCKQ